LKEELIKGTFLRRLNRFAVQVRVDGEVLEAFLPNSGRLKGILVEGREVLLRPRSSPRRKTSLDLWGVSDGRKWIMVDSRWANYLLPWAAERGLIRGLEGINDLKAEVKAFGRRLDFIALRGATRVWIESKSVTHVEDGVALFPDAPTSRGRSHLEVLKKIRARGDDALVAFMVLREDARAFSPHWRVDEAFSQALREAASAGVRVEAVCFKIGEGEVLDGWPIPVIL